MTDHERMWKDHGEDLDSVICATGQWAGTRFGIENTRGPYLYSIPWADVLPSRKWPEHMAEKNWVHLPSFEAMHAKALDLKAKRVSE